MGAVIFLVINKFITIADPIFFMISGSMLLNSEKNYTFKTILKKKIPKLCIAFIFWSFVYSFFENVVIKWWHGGIKEHILADFLRVFVKGYNHLWFIYALIFAYLCVPFLKKICESKEAEQVFIILASIAYILPFINSINESELLNQVADNTKLFAAKYILFFVIGHYLSEYTIVFKRRLLLYAASIAVFVYCMCFEVNYEYDSFQNELIAVSVFLIFKYGISKIKLNQKTINIIVKISSYTFGCYLSHMLFITALGSVPSMIGVNRFTNIIILVLSFVVFLLSIFLTWVISKIPLLKKYII